VNRWLALATLRAGTQAAGLDLKAFGVQAILNLAAHEVGEMRIGQVDEKLGLDVLNLRAANLFHPTIEMIEPHRRLSRA